MAHPKTLIFCVDGEVIFQDFGRIFVFFRTLLYIILSTVRFLFLQGVLKNNRFAMLEKFGSETLQVSEMSVGFYYLLLEQSGSRHRWEFSDRMDMSYLYGLSYAIQ